MISTQSVSRFGPELCQQPINLAGHLSVIFAVPWESVYPCWMSSDYLCGSGPQPIWHCIIVFFALCYLPLPSLAIEIFGWERKQVLTLHMQQMTYMMAIWVRLDIEQFSLIIQLTCSGRSATVRTLITFCEVISPYRVMRSD